MKRLLLNIMRRFLVIVPFVVLFLIMYGQLIALEESNAREKIVSEHTGHLRLMDYMIENAFDEYYTTLHLIRNSDELVTYLADPNEQTREEVKKFFERMAFNRSYIKGLVFGSPTDGPDIALEAFTKPHRIYDQQVPYEEFWNTMVNDLDAVPDTGLYFSSITMFSKDGGSMTADPVILTGIPVSSNGYRIGVIGMMVDGNHILSMIGQFFADHPGEISFFLIDGLGREIFSSLPESGSPFDGGMISRIYPKIVERSSTEESGSFEVDGTHLYYQVFDPYHEQSSYYSSFDHFLMGVVSFTDEDVVALEHSFILRNKELRWILAVVLFILGGIINVLTYFRRNDRELLAVSNLVSEQSHDGVVISDSLLHVTYCNKTFEMMTDMSNKEIKTGSHGVYDLEGQVFNADRVMSETSDGRSPVESWKGFVWLKGKHHIALTYLMISRIAKTQGHIVNHVGLYSYPRNLSKESFGKLFASDGTVHTEMDRYPTTLLEERHANGRPFSLVYLKLVDMDVVEAQYTLEEHYQFGKQVRARIGTLLSGGELLLQYSPDTYLMVMEGDQDSLSRRLEIAATLFAKPLGMKGKQGKIRIRGGVSTSSEECADVTLMLRQARMSLAAQDHFGQDGLLSYNESVDEQLSRHHQILQAIPHAIEQEELRIFYQPVIEVKTGKIRGAEALLRWKHPQLGQLSPAEFIPIIEQNHLERTLGIYVTEHVARFLNGLGDLVDNDFSISMNLCPSELQDSDLVGQVVRTLAKYSIPHSRLVIELTERTLLTDLNAANKVLRRLGDEQIQVAIDDFGTGFSSLSYLHQLDVDVLKIDRSFIKNYPETDEGVILKAMVGMAKELEMLVFVEGIETSEQLEFIHSLGVDAYQGFLFSPAVDPESFRRMLQQ